MVAVVEAPNDESIAACALSVGKLGNIKIHTLRAFQASEVDSLLQKV